MLSPHDAMAIALAKQRWSPLIPLMPYLSSLRRVEYLALPAGATTSADGAAVAPFAGGAFAGGVAAAPPDAVPVDAPSPRGSVPSSAELGATLLMDASPSEILRAVRHRLVHYVRQHRLSAFLIGLTWLGLLAWGQRRRAHRRHTAQSRRASRRSSEPIEADELLDEVEGEDEDEADAPLFPLPGGAARGTRRIPRSPSPPETLPALAGATSFASSGAVSEAPTVRSVLTVPVALNMALRVSTGAGGFSPVGSPSPPSPSSPHSSSSPAASQPHSSPDTPTLQPSGGAAAPALGTALGTALPSRYTQEFIQGARLGKGGFGRVYRARHVLDGFEYAVKKVLLTGSQREQERAVREATCLAKLDHPNVVRYYQVWKEELERGDDDALAEFDDSEEEEEEEGSTSAMTEEDSNNGTRRSRARGWRSHGGTSAGDSSSITGGALPGEHGPLAVLHIQMQLCELTMRDYLREPGRETTLEGAPNRSYLVQLFAGLQHIHRQSLIHRDLTPANVFITYDRKTIKIGDFGLSREMTTDALTMQASAAADLDKLGSLGSPTIERTSSLSRRARRELSYGGGGSVTRGVGTTFYMSPEQRACQPYDHTVDIYSAGVILLELCHPFATDMERFVVLSNLQRHVLPKHMNSTPAGELIQKMTHELPSQRPSVDALLASPLLAAHGHICVSVRRKEQYEFMQKIQETIERVVRIKTINVTDVASSATSCEPSAASTALREDLVELEYFVERAPPSTTATAASADKEGGGLETLGPALETLRSDLHRLSGVVRVTGAAFAQLQSSPKTTPASSRQGGNGHGGNGHGGAGHGGAGHGGAGHGAGHGAQASSKSLRAVGGAMASGKSSPLTVATSGKTPSPVDLPPSPPAPPTPQGKLRVLVGVRPEDMALPPSMSPHAEMGADAPSWASDRRQTKLFSAGTRSPERSLLTSRPKRASPPKAVPNSAPMTVPNSTPMAVPAMSRPDAHAGGKGLYNNLKGSKRKASSSSALQASVTVRGLSPTGFTTGSASLDSGWLGYQHAMADWEVEFEDTRGADEDDDDDDDEEDEDDDGAPGWGLGMRPKPVLLGVPLQRGKSCPPTPEHILSAPWTAKEDVEKHLQLPAPIGGKRLPLPTPISGLSGSKWQPPIGRDSVQPEQPGQPEQQATRPSPQRPKAKGLRAPPVMRRVHSFGELEDEISPRAPP